MSLRLKIVLLVLAFMLPYMAIMVPTILKYQSGQLPTWIPLAGGFYLLFTVVFLTLFTQRLAKKQNSGAVQQNPQVTVRARNAGRLLILFSSLLFLCP